jgi:hypothetical protein
MRGAGDLVLSATREIKLMSTISDLARHSLRLLGAATLLTASTFVGQRAEAISPVNPGLSAAGRAADDSLMIEVRGGHGGGGGGGGRSAGGMGGGRSVGAAFVGRSAVSTGAVVASAPRFAGHAFGHHRHFHGVFVGGVYYDDYPYDDDAGYYDYPPVYPAFVAGGGCHRVMTAYGPRTVCHHRAARHHRHTRRHHQRRHHHA